MPQADVQISDRNEAVYEELISLIENSQQRLAPIIVACDDASLRQQIILRYEQEARQSGIRPYRIELGKEPSIRAALIKLKETDPHLQSGGAAVFTVAGAEFLLRVKVRDSEAQQTQLDKFYGYLQWTREGLREFRYPIVLWVTHRILKEMSRLAPDFWSWRKAVLRFVAETPAVMALEIEPLRIEPQTEKKSLPLLKDLQEQIAQLEATSPESPNLAVLYNQLGEVYVQRVEQGEAKDLEQEREEAIAAFQKAIAQHEASGDKSAQMNSLNWLGGFFGKQSNFTEAIVCYEKALSLAREMGDSRSEAWTLNGLGYSYMWLNQHQQAISFHQQSLKIKRHLGDREGEAASLAGLGGCYYKLGQLHQAIEAHQQALAIWRELGDRDRASGALCNLAHAYDALGQYVQAIELYQQALEIQREFKRRDWEANSLGGLGFVYYKTGEYQQSLNCHQQALEIRRKIGDRHGEAGELLRIGFLLAKLDHRWEARKACEQALEICTQLKLDYRIEECKDALYNLQRIISPAPIVAPGIDRSSSHPRRSGFSQLSQAWRAVFGSFKNRQ